LEGKTKCWDQNKKLKGELMVWRIKPKCKLRFKVAHFYLFILNLGKSLLFKYCDNRKHAMDWRHC
jgi:hypothetical protein